MDRRKFLKHLGMLLGGIIAARFLSGCGGGNSTYQVKISLAGESRAVEVPAGQTALYAIMTAFPSYQQGQSWRYVINGVKYNNNPVWSGDYKIVQDSTIDLTPIV